MASALEAILGVGRGEAHLGTTTTRALPTAWLSRPCPDGARKHVVKEWHVSGHVIKGPASGLCTGILAFIWELLDGVISIVSLPIQSACYHPSSPFHGLVLGLLAALLLVVLRIFYAPIICLDRFLTGVANSTRPGGACASCAAGSADDADHAQPVDHVMDPEPALTAISQAARGRPLCTTDYVREDAGHADGASRLPLPLREEVEGGPRRLQLLEQCGALLGAQEELAWGGEVG